MIDNHADQYGRFSYLDVDIDKNKNKRNRKFDSLNCVHCIVFNIKNTSKWIITELRVLLLATSSFILIYIMKFRTWKGRVSVVRTEINSDKTCARRKMFIITETVLFTKNGIVTGKLAKHFHCVYPTWLTLKIIFNLRVSLSPRCQVTRFSHWCR